MERSDEESRLEEPGSVATQIELMESLILLEESVESVESFLHRCRVFDDARGAVGDHRISSERRAKVLQALVP